MNSVLFLEFLDAIWHSREFHNDFHYTLIQQAFADHLARANVNLEEVLGPSVSDLERVKGVKKYFSWTAVAVSALERK